MKMFRLAALALLLGGCVASRVAAFAQNNGELLPPIYPVFHNVNGVSPIALGFICTTATGTNTNLATYRDAALTQSNANPIHLNVAGRAVNGSALVAIYLQGASYRITAYAAGTGNLCNGQDVGAQIWQRDGVYSLAALNALVVFSPKNLDQTRHCSQFAGASASDKMAACIADLPTGGGIADATGIVGNQTINGDPFGGTTKPVVLKVCAATFATSATIIVPENSLLVGCGLSSKFVSSITSGNELVRLNGDHAAIQEVWLTGTGQGGVGTTPNGNRGIWIGQTDHTTVVSFARVEGVTIDNFKGNGISGAYEAAVIKGNFIADNTDANIFCPTDCNDNLFEGNTLTRSRYSGLDINGSNNRVIGNHSDDNGAGAVDQASWSGYIVAYTSGNSASNNIFIGNTADSNFGCGFRIYGMGATAGAVNSPRGNTFTGNVATNHTIAYTQTSPTQTEWSGGFCILGGNDNTLTGNISVGNVINYVVTGFASVGTSTGTILKGNQSFNAVTNAALTGAGKPAGIGYLFPGGTRIDAAGGPSGIAASVILDGNWDQYSASDSFLWNLTGGAGTWTGWTIKNNHSENAGRYGFSVADFSSFVLYNADCSNYVTGATTASYNAFPYCDTTQTDQATSKVTTVVKNGTLSGRIRMCTDARCGVDANNQLQACCIADSFRTFQVTNNVFTTTRDQVVATVSGGPGNYALVVKDTGAGTFTITLQSLNAALTDDAVIIDYYINKR